MRSTHPVYAAPVGAPAVGPSCRPTRLPAAAGEPIPFRLVVVKILMIAGIAVLPLPALFLGARGVPGRRRFAAEPADHVSQILLVILRLLVLLVIFVLSGVTLVSLVGALIKAVDMPGLVYVFFFLDLLLGALVVLTFGRRVRPPARRRASPAAR
jgi:hypothetical protein